MNGLYAYKDFNVLIKDAFHSHAIMMDNVSLDSSVEGNLVYHSYRAILMVDIVINGLRVRVSFNACKRNVLHYFVNIGKTVQIILNVRMANVYIQLTQVGMGNTVMNGQNAWVKQFA